jgi:S-formylglutathione hydrolase FrmB
MPSRRQFLLGTGGLVLAGASALGATHPVALRRLLRGSPTSSHSVPSGPAGQVVSGTFRSASRRAVTGWSVAYPAAVTDGLPSLVVLHGRNNDHRDAFGSHHLDRYLSAAVRSGVPAFAIASVDGGSHSYWHKRPSGEDPQAMIVEELLPVLAARGLRTDRVALGGWSMGGYGALLLASRLGASKVAAVAADSPALWTRFADSAAGAFDGSADVRANDVFSVLPGLYGIPTRISCGTSDPFLPGVRTFLSRVPSAQHELAPGAHDVAWWQHAAPSQLAFVGRTLAA